MSVNLQWQPPGPVSKAFMDDVTSDVMAIMGPVGSGKTSTAVMKLLRMAQMQKKSPVDGVRYSKWAVIRDTYRNLNRTTVKTFKNWLPKGAGTWTGGGNDPATFHLRARLADGSIMDLQIEFIALGDNTIEDVARGWEGTGVWLNEADLLPPDVLGYMYGRTGRYPSALHGGPSWHGAILDYNAPDTENYVYKLFEEDLPQGYALYKQPGGRDANAENLMHLPPGYYDGQVKLNMAMGRPDLVRRMVDNQYGYSRDGHPVYPEYRDNFHCAEYDLEPVDGLPIKISCDQGAKPAALLRQTLPNGQRRYLAEIYTDKGAKGLADEVKRVMARDFPGFRLIGGKCDPAGNTPDPDDPTKGTWLDGLNRHLGLTGAARIRPAETNKIDKCTSAARILFTELVDSGQPRALISKRCKMLRKALNSAYCYKKMKNSSGGVADKPCKVFPTSDLANAFEFDALDEGGFEDVVAKARRSKAFGSGKMFKAKVEVRV